MAGLRARNKSAKSIAKYGILNAAVRRLFVKGNEFRISQVIVVLCSVAQWKLNPSLLATTGAPLKWQLLNLTWRKAMSNAAA